MTAYLKEIMDLIKTDLDAASGDFSESITVNKKYRIEYGKGELKTPVVTLSPAGLEFEPYSRGQDRVITRVIIALQCDVDGDDDAVAIRVEELMFLQQEILLWFNRRDFGSEWTIDETTDVIVYDDDHLNKFGVYSATITNQYTKLVEVGS